MGPSSVNARARTSAGGLLAAAGLVAGFIGISNLLEGVVEGEREVRIGTGEKIAAPVPGECGRGETVQLSIRPEKIAIGREAPTEGDPSVNRVEGIVREAAYFGSYSVYHVALPSGRVLKALRNNAEREVQDLPQRGEPAWLGWLPESPVVLLR